MMDGLISTLEKEEKKPVAVLDSETKDKSDERDLREGGLFCAWCSSPVTGRDNMIQISGSIEHTFANPGGYIFRIGCFGIAPGCVAVDKESGDFTWFAGYDWSAAVCVRCKSHLGWRFRSSDDEFFGLILKHLVEKETPPV